MSHPAPSTESPIVTAWQPCDKCGGVRIQGRHCLAHLTDSEWADEVEHLRNGGRLDARGVAISGELSTSLCNALGVANGKIWLPGSAVGAVQSPSGIDVTDVRFLSDVDFRDARFCEQASFNGARFCGDVDFRGATFSKDARFEGTQFSGLADFDGTHFSGSVDFSSTQFSSGAIFANARFSDVTNFTDTQFVRRVMFQDAQFTSQAGFLKAQFFGPAGFRDTQFSGEADFVGAQFSNHASFQGATFSEAADFTEALFLDHAYFSKAHFSGVARFVNAQFSGQTEFCESQFADEVRFARAQFGDSTIFDGAAFRVRITLGPVVGSGLLSFDRVDFAQGMQLDASVPRLSCKGSRFGWGADLNIRWAEITLDRANFMERSRLVGVGDFPKIDDGCAQSCHVDRQLDADPRPRLLSLRQANVERLALGSVDLSGCYFFGAHGLDQLRIEADCRFALQPHHWRYARRRTLAEEHQWRVSQPNSDDYRQPRQRKRSADRARGWYPPQCKVGSWITPEAEVLDPARIASLYRALRKGFEDRKDEPGAADFYYGEMEMRRLSSVDPRNLGGQETDDRATHVVLTLYWALAGYGLRASRASFAFAAVIGLAALAFAQWGFNAHTSYGRAALLALQGSVSLLRAPEAELSLAGQAIYVFTKLAGPLCFGLGLFSLRGRIKR
jgi:hypothetical protein